MVRKFALATVSLMLAGGAYAAAPTSSSLGSLKKVASVDARFPGYNIEMVDVTGGQFWAPYGSPAGEVYTHHNPLDLGNQRLVGLAKGLGPTYLRVSGTWANNTYLAAPGEDATKTPAGFAQTMSAERWADVVRYAKAVDAKLVTSFAVSNGVRDANGVWTSVQAQRQLDTIRAAGGDIYAAEYFNEPNIPIAGADIPKNYTAANFGRDFQIFHKWARANAPHMKILGTGSVGMGIANMPNVPGLIDPTALMASIPNSVDIVSYHFYGAMSPRCAALKFGQTSEADALTWKWLDLTLAQYKLTAARRDKYQPGRDMMITETAQVGCGGSPWASTFLDTFRYTNQLGLLAQNNVKAIMHDTLTSSDYALIDGTTMTPNPNYWSAYLWRRTMGTKVLASPKSPSPNVRIYAQCLPEGRGGVGLVAMNVGTTAQKLNLGRRAIAWTMTGQPVATKAVMINGQSPAMDDSGNFSGVGGTAISGSLALPGQSIAFVKVPGANNAACR